MVRADDQSSRKSDAATVSRRRVAHKEPYVAPLWPCKINGCGKKFVREADLKRHQRTTKTHCLPSFTCQECDASFTRTDALRRHQKSRHHVDKAPTRNNEGSEEPASAGEANAASTASTRSRSPSPIRGSRKRLRDRRDRELPPLEATGPSRYYRQHTALTTSRVPLPPPPPPPPPPSTPPPALRPLTHSSSLNAILASPIPTPRLHAATWSSYPTSWRSSSPRTGQPHYVPHYRYPPVPNMVPPLLAPIYPQPSAPSTPDSSPSHRQSGGDKSSPRCTRGGSPTRVYTITTTPPPLPAGPGSGSAPAPEPDDLASSPETETDSQKITDIEACIDPATGITAEEVKAAMAAVLKSVRQERAKQVEVETGVGMGLGLSGGGETVDGSPFLSETPSYSRSAVAARGVPNVRRSPGMEEESSEDEDSDVDMGVDERGSVKEFVGCRKVKTSRADELHEYESPLDQPSSPMEHIINEVEEPMLHPAELLTQESPATPPSP